MIIGEAWAYRGEPEVMLAKFQEFFEEFHWNAVYIFEYASALDLLRKQQRQSPYIKLRLN